jgi:hypothetical protein
MSPCLPKVPWQVKFTSVLCRSSTFTDLLGSPTYSIFVILRDSRHHIPFCVCSLAANGARAQIVASPRGTFNVGERWSGARLEEAVYSLSQCQYRLLVGASVAKRRQIEAALSTVDELFPSSVVGSVTSDPDRAPIIAFLSMLDVLLSFLRGVRTKTESA